MATDTRTRILESALGLLRTGASLSLESAAQHTGVTKPGLMYHFRTKEALMFGLVDQVVDRWDAELARLAGGPPSEIAPQVRIRAYAEFALVTNFDESDLVVLADPRLREPLCARWDERMADWVAIPEDLPDATRGRLLSIRLLADGAWFASATGVLTPDRTDRDRVLGVVRELLEARP